MGMLEDLNKRKVTKDQNKSFKQFVHTDNTDVLKTDSLPAQAVASPQPFFCFVFCFYVFFLFFSFRQYDSALTTDLMSGNTKQYSFIFCR